MPIFRPALFQGARMRRGYFEGWYFKQVSADGKPWSFIPGISLGHDGSIRRSFVQAIDGSTGTTRWYDFPIDSFKWHRHRLDLSIGPNHFSKKGLELDLDGPDGRLKASLTFGQLTRFPFRPWRPGVMGPYSFVPFMECNHGLVSMDHKVDGFVDADGFQLSMDGGRGYIEKDWGRSMPSAWIWSQSNSFPEQGDSLMFSLADIPWMGKSFPGFLCVGRFAGADASEGMKPGHKGPRPRIWATWNGSCVSDAIARDDRLDMTISRRDETLELRFRRGRGGLLLAPVAGFMDRRIAESVDASIDIRLRKGSRILYEGSAFPAGLETVGDLTTLGVSVAAAEYSR